MPVLFRNARIVTATEDYHADLLCVGERIARIESAIDPASCPAGTRQIDARGKLLFPGFIDPHVHVYLPFMGTYAKDTWETASRAAIMGGTTTLIEMVCPGKSEEPSAAFDLWLSKAQGVSSCDYSFHMGVTRFDDLAEAQLRAIAARGIRSFKVFLAYKGAFGVDDRELYHTLRLAKELGVVVTAHCENETLVAERCAELLAAGKTGPEWHEPSRPVQVEAEGVQHLMTFAELTGAEVYIVHTSCREAVERALAGFRRGVRGHIETVIPYLTLDSSAAERPGFEGAKFVMSPPIRAKAHQEYLWSALRAGHIATVATDHAPFDFDGQKAMGKTAFTKIPNGIPSVEHRVHLLYSEGVAKGRISLNQFVDCASTRAARIFGLRGKGSISVGADADLVLFDPEARWTISAKTHHMATDYDAFEGWPITGRSEVVCVRGQVMAEGGKFVGPGGGGRLVDRA
jgi:dihydropyrimidinase